MFHLWKKNINNNNTGFILIGYKVPKLTFQHYDKYEYKNGKERGMVVEG